MKDKSILIMFLLIVLHSCGTLQKQAPATGEVEDQNLIEFREAYKAITPEIDYLQVKSRINADIKGKSHSASLKLYFEKEDQIWANVSVLGITGARANITPESVQAYEVLDKTFIDSDFSFFNQKLHVNFITFDRLKQLLLGQLFLIEPWNAYQLETTSDNLYALSYKQNEALKKEPQEGKYIHTFFLDSSYRLNKIDISDSHSDTQVKVYYNNWVLVDGNNLPSEVRIEVTSENNDKVELEYYNFDFNAMNPPFRIPSRYKEREIK